MADFQKEIKIAYPATWCMQYGESVYVTRKVPGPWLSRLQSKYPTRVHDGAGSPSRHELLKALKDKSAVLCMLSDKMDSEAMDAAGQSLRIISTYSTGFDHIDVQEATRRGILVTYTADVLAEATADLTFALILAAARNIVSGHRLTRSGRWRVGWMPDLLLGGSVSGRTLGIIGLGRIGSAVARRARGFSMKVLYTSRNRKPEAEAATGARYVTLEELLSESDFVSIHASLAAPPPSEGEARVANGKGPPSPVIDMPRLKMMKKSAYLINTARGQLIDEPALARALKSGMIAGAGLDVYRKEPLPRSSPLCKLDNVTLLPHIGSATFETRERMAEVAVTCIEKVLDGGLPDSAFTVNRELLTRRQAHRDSG